MRPIDPFDSKPIAGCGTPRRNRCWTEKPRPFGECFDRPRERRLDRGANFATVRARKRKRLELGLPHPRGIPRAHADLHLRVDPWPPFRTSYTSAQAPRTAP